MNNINNEYSENIVNAKLDVSIILPAYNEELAIGNIIDSIRKAMANTQYKYEIIVIDDCSTDKTVEKAKEKNVRVIKRPVNGGSGASRKTGIQYARGDIIVMLDADGTYTPSDIPKMLEYFPEYDQVNGARTSEQGTSPHLRSLAKWFLRHIAMLLTMTHIPDLNTGFKAFKRNIMLNYLWTIPNGFSCVTSMTLAFITNGHFVKYIDTEYHPRVGVSKFHPIKDTFLYFFTIFRMIIYFTPLRFFFAAGVALALTGSALSVYHRIAYGFIVNSDIVILLMSLLCFVLGIVSELIISSNKRSADMNLAQNRSIFERDV